MSEEPSVVGPDAAPEQDVGASLGARLHAAREHLGLDIDEAARQLCLSPRQLAALEADNIGMLPSPTFARGFIRNYARLLQLEAAPLLALYRDMVPENTGGLSISLHSEGIPIQTGNRKAWLTYLVASVLIVLAGGSWWLYMDWRENTPAQPVNTVKPVGSVSPAPAAKAAAEQQAEPPPMGAGLLPAELVQPPVAANPSAVSAQAPVSGASAPRIVMKFSQSSWVRVLDRDGKEVLNKMKPADSEETIEGIPPFRLDVGNAAGVQLSYNGQPVDLAPSTKANVAHLTLE